MTCFLFILKFWDVVTHSILLPDALAHPRHTFGCSGVGSLRVWRERAEELRLIIWSEANILGFS